MPNSRKRYSDRSHSHSEERDSLSLVLKRIEHRLGRLEQIRKRRRRCSGTPSYSDDSRSYRSSSESSSSSYTDPIDQATLDVENTHTSPPNEYQETSGRPSDELISIFTAESDAKRLFSAPIQPELAACWTRILSSGLAVETKENIIRKYLPPENCQELSPPPSPLINPELKRASPENSVCRDARIAQLQQQIGSLNDIGRLLCDINYNESVSRRELLCLNLNKDFKEALKDSAIERWLFGSNLDTTLRTAKELEKSTEQLKVPKKSYRQLQGNLKRPFLSTQQSGQNFVFPRATRGVIHKQNILSIGQRIRPRKSPVTLIIGQKWEDIFSTQFPYSGAVKLFPIAGFWYWITGPSKTQQCGGDERVRALIEVQHTICTGRIQEIW
nr:unnamed protein product [Callosobruchus analis]